MRALLSYTHTHASLDPYGDGDMEARPQGVHQLRNNSEAVSESPCSPW